jgi:hypothetical protein
VGSYAAALPKVYLIGNWPMLQTTRLAEPTVGGGSAMPTFHEIRSTLRHLHVLHVLAFSKITCITCCPSLFP